LPNKDLEIAKQRALGPNQIKELNEMLENYVDVPRAASLLNLRYRPTPTRNRSSSFDQEESNHEFDDLDDEEFSYLLQELYSRKTRYELNLSEYERPRHQLVEYLGYRRKFE
jgi:hypothetical protein